MIKWFNALDTIVKRVVTIAVIALLLVVIGLTVGYCRSRDEAREQRGKTEQSEGRTVSAVEAITAINDLGERSNATDAQVENATNAIRQADPADRDRVFRYHACLLQHRSDCDGLL